MKKLGFGSKKRQGFSLAEILVALTIIVALSTAAFFGFNHVQGTRRVAQCQQDLDNIANAIVTWESLDTTINGSYTGNVANLVTGTIAAANATDGQAHSNILRWQGNPNFTNPWGGAYTINSVTRTITTQGNNQTYTKGY